MKPEQKFNRNMKRLCLIVIGMSIVLFARAQQVLKLEEAIATALQNNFDIRLLKNDSAVYALDKSYANYAFYPRLNASSAVIFNNNNQKQKLADGSERKGNNIRSSNVNASLNLNWTLFDGLKMFTTRDKLNEYVKFGSLLIKDQLNNTVADICQTYYGISRQKQQLKAIREQMAVNEERLKQAEKKLAVGLGAKPDVLQAKLDLNAQQASILNQQTVIDQLKEQLNLLMGTAKETSFDVTDSIPIDAQLKVEEVLSGVEKGNPTLGTLKEQIKIANLTLKEQKAERYPILQFNSAYNFAKTNNKTVVNNFTPLFNQNNGFNYGLSLSVPIFNAYNVRRLIRQAELDIQYQTLSYDYQRFRILNTVSQAYKNYLQQLQVLKLEEENILLAKENVSISLERFRLGITTTLELRETQKSLEDAYNRLINARYNAALAEIALKRLKGAFVQ
ncbi:MAG TPA: TolC family protein [Ferruginibacter sp.]|nr:TolC family protein [Ferruginibacter sp.]